MDEKFAGMSPENALDDKSRYRREVDRSPESVPEKRLWARLRTWRFERLRSGGGRWPERELLWR